MPPPIEYTTNYPDRAENAKPDKNIRQYLTKYDQAPPGAAGGNINTPAGEDGDILTSGFTIGVTLVVGHLEGDSVFSSTLIGMGWKLSGAGLAVTEVPLVTIRGKTAGNSGFNQVFSPSFILLL